MTNDKAVFLQLVHCPHCSFFPRTKALLSLADAEPYPTIVVTMKPEVHLDKHTKRIS